MKKTLAILALSIFYAGIFCSESLAQEIIQSEQTTEESVIEPIEVKRPEIDKDAIISLSYENDIFGGEDNNYTNGVRVSYISPEKPVPAILRRSADLIPFYPNEARMRWGLSFGQNMYTPDDITLVNPPTDDQPYAGWLYGSATVIADTEATLDTFQVTLGVVGPAAAAENTQKFIHKLVDSPRPQGWDYQLENEPGVVLTYERKWRNMFNVSPGGLDFDLAPGAGVNLGNVYTDAGINLIARVGHDLPSDYGPPLIRPSLGGSDFFVPGQDFGWYFFGGVEGRAVARNIFLDGNTFTDSRSVDKENFVGGAQVGAAVTFSDVRLAYTHVFKTKEFETQREANQYGAVSVSFRF